MQKVNYERFGKALERRQSMNFCLRSDVRTLRKLLSPFKRDLTLKEVIGMLDVDFTKVTCFRVYFNGECEVLSSNGFKVDIDCKLYEVFKLLNF